MCVSGVDLGECKEFARALDMVSEEHCHQEGGYKGDSCVSWAK